MEFAGDKYIYLSKLKKEKIQKIRKSEKENEGDAPVPLATVDKPKDDISNKLNQFNQGNMMQKPEGSIVSDDSDDAYLEVNAKNFNVDLVNSNIQMNQQAAPDLKFKKAIDTNVCVIRHNSLEKQPEEELGKLYKCEKCQAYLNKYSNLNPTLEPNKYEWKCEFCFNLNKLNIEKNNLPKCEIIETCLEPVEKNEQNLEDDSSLIFCFDISGSMCQSYNVGKNLKDKFNKILGKKPKQTYYQNIESDDFDFSNYDFNQNNTNYISRLDLVKLSIEDNIKSLLKDSPNVKVGIVSFGSEIEVKGDCLSNVMIIKEKDMNNETKIKSLGEENTNLIKAPIKQSSQNIIKSLRATEENGSTALGPAVLFSLSLLKKAKVGSRIFLCTDGMSNLGIGDISEDREKAKDFYVNIGNMAKEKGVVISLITFEDSESEIEILKNMVEFSGGEIIRVNPNEILDGFNDLLENKTLATEVNMKINLNKCMTFRDQDKKDLTNELSSLSKKLGNVTRETENYYELKFKHASKLAEMNEIDFNTLKNLIFQTEISYKNVKGGKYIRVITKSLVVSDNKEEINKVANMNIVSTLQIQKSAKMAGKGDLMGAQAQIHVARNYLNLNQNYNMNNQRIFHQFNNNINSFHNNLNMMNNMNMMNNNMNMMNNNMNMMNNNMMGGNNMNFQNMNNMNNFQNMNNMNNFQNMKNMNNFQNMKNMNNFQNMNNMNNCQNINNMNNMNNMFMMFQKWLQGQVRNTINKNNFTNNMNNFNNNMNNFNNNMNNNNFQLFNNNSNSNTSNNNASNNQDNTGDQAPEGILERGPKYMEFKVDDCDIRNIKFSASSGLNVMISINKNKPLKKLFEAYAQRVGFPEFHLGKNIVFLFNALTIDVNDENPINSLFPKDLITITVIDQKEIIGANDLKYS